MTILRLRQVLMDAFTGMTYKNYQGVGHAHVNHETLLKIIA